MKNTRFGARRALTVALAAALAAACGAAPTATGGPTGAPASADAPASSFTPASVAPAPSTSTPDGSPTQAEIDRLMAAVQANPNEPAARRDLGFALLQRIRETEDPSLYAPATASFEAALALEPEDAVAIAGVAAIQLGQHQFAEALKSADRAIALSPSLLAAHAARFDALVELGRYDEADKAGGEMLGLSIELSSLARVSYLDELRGKLPEALAAMRRAAESPGLAPENTAYVRALLANLLVYDGDPAGARAQYDEALALVPSHAPSIAGLGRLAVGADDLDAAIVDFERASALLPLPEYLVALGDAQLAAGDSAAAAKSYDLARAQIQRFQATGTVVDVDLAIFEADHGDPATALADATAAHAAAATVRTADAMAWALHRLGRDEEAAAYSREALRLGSIDPRFRYHAGAIAAALGDGDAARRDLTMALALDPGFSATGAADARRLLMELT